MLRALQVAADWTIRVSQAGGYVLLDERGYPQARGDMTTLTLNPRYYRANPNRPFKALDGVFDRDT